MKKILWAVCFFLVAFPAFAQQQQQQRPSIVGNLYERQPVDLIDADPAPEGTWQASAIGRYEKQDNGNLKLFVPEVEFGLARDFELDVAGPFHWGSATPHDGWASADITGLYRFYHETDNAPAMAIQEKLIFNRNRLNDKGLDSQLYFIATKTLTAPSDSSRQRVHFNIYWYYNSSRTSYQRLNFFGGRVGYDIMLMSNLMFVADYILEQQIIKSNKSNIIEAGFRQQVADQWLISYGAGFGFGAQSPDYRVTASVQYSF